MAAVTAENRTLEASKPLDRSVGRALRTSEAAAYVGLSASTLNKKRVTGLDSPVYVQAGPNRAVRYRVSDLDAWMEARLLRSTSDR